MNRVEITFTVLYVLSLYTELRTTKNKMFNIVLK